MRKLRLGPNVGVASQHKFLPSCRPIGRFAKRRVVIQSECLYNSTMTDPLHEPLSMAAQTAYAELLDQLRAAGIGSLRALPGSFQYQIRRGKPYVYYSFRDLDGTNRLSYVGPDDARVRELIERHDTAKSAARPERLRAQARAAIALGCAVTLPKHYRAINRLGQYGFFRAGGILIGTHAFIAMGNLLGVRWRAGDRTQDVDLAHAGRNISVALGANLELSVYDALTSLEMGLLPITEFSGKTGAQYRNPSDPELRLDFVTPQVRGGGPVVLPELGLALECLKFMEFSLEQTTQAVLMSNEGACLVNIPAPQRYAIHKLIVQGERPIEQRVKANKDVEQSAALLQCLLAASQGDLVAAAWADATGRGRGWLQRCNQGRNALLARHPELALSELWPAAARKTARASPRRVRRPQATGLTKVRPAKYFR